MKLTPSRSGLRMVALGSVLLFALAGCRTDSSVAANYHEYAYVTNGKSNSVTVLDARYFRSLKTINVGKSPTGIAVNSHNNEVYVVNTDSESVSVINAETNEVAATMSVHRTPSFI